MTILKAEKGNTHEACKESACKCAVCTIITCIVQRDAEVAGRDARRGWLCDPKFHANGVKRVAYIYTHTDRLHHVSEVSLSLLVGNASIFECIECGFCMCV